MLTLRGLTLRVADFVGVHEALWALPTYASASGCTCGWWNGVEQCYVRTLQCLDLLPIWITHALATLCDHVLLWRGLGCHHI